MHTKIEPKDADQNSNEIDVAGATIVDETVGSDSAIQHL